MNTPTLSPEQILAELDDVTRTIPTIESIIASSDESIYWIGRARAAMYLWNPIRSAEFNALLPRLHIAIEAQQKAAYRQIRILLAAVLHELRLQTKGPTAIHIEKGRPFDYFDQLRKIIESATKEVFIVDRYLSADFASRYLPFVKPSVNVRILASMHVAKLAPALSLSATQNRSVIELRKSSQDTHDRHIFIDGSICYLSGGSFCDGGALASTTLTEIVDAANAVLTTCEDAWQRATPVALN